MRFGRRSTDFGSITNRYCGKKLLKQLQRPAISKTSCAISSRWLDPALSLFDANGNVIVTDDNWKDSQQSEIAATGLAPTDDRESAVIATLPGGAYTAIVRGVNGMTGVGLVEVFNLH